MVVDTKNEKLEFLQPIESISEDTLASIVGAHIFVDLLKDARMPVAKDVIKANSRAIPDAKSKPANPNDFNGIFNEL